MAFFELIHNLQIQNSDDIATSCINRIDVTPSLSDTIRDPRTFKVSHAGSHVVTFTATGGGVTLRLWSGNEA